MSASYITHQELSMERIDLDQLKERAEKATPGPWEVQNFNGRPYEIHGMFNGRFKDKIVDCNWGSATQRGQDDYAFIASLDPQTVLALLRVVRAAQMVASLERGPLLDDHDPRKWDEAMHAADAELDESLLPFQDKSHG